MTRTSALLIVALIAAVPMAALAGGSKKPAVGKTLLKVEVDPASSIYVDGKLRATSAKTKLLELSPGPHIVRLVHQRDEHEDQVILKKGETVEFHWVFEGVEAKPKAKPAAEPAPDDAAEAPPADEPATDERRSIREERAEPADPAPDEPRRRGTGVKAKKRDPLEGIEAPK